MGMVRVLLLAINFQVHGRVAPGRKFKEIQIAHLNYQGDTPGDKVTDPVMLPVELLVAMSFRTAVRSRSATRHVPINAFSPAILIALQLRILDIAAILRLLTHHLFIRNMLYFAILDLYN